jgi:hypothetical protein
MLARCGAVDLGAAAVRSMPDRAAVVTPMSGESYCQSGVLDGCVRINRPAACGSAETGCQVSFHAAASPVRAEPGLEH